MATLLQQPLHGDDVVVAAVAAVVVERRGCWDKRRGRSMTLVVV